MACVCSYREADYCSGTIVSGPKNARVSRIERCIWNFYIKNLPVCRKFFGSPGTCTTHNKAKIEAGHSLCDASRPHFERGLLMKAAPARELEKCLE